MSDLRARPARPDDAEAIARIYNEGIADRVATFETRQRTADELRTAIAARAPRYPTVVVERDGAVVAWAGASEYRPRDCYAGIGEYSVYVAREQRGRGAGREAMLALLSACEATGLWKLVSRIFPENEASLALMRSLGFREVGTYRRHAKLDGEWRDVVIVERLLGPAADGVSER